MNYKDYKNRKNNGFVKVIQAAKSIVFSEKQWEKYTGKVTEEIHILSLNDLNIAKEIKKKELEDIDELIADYKKAEKEQLTKE
jgi:uncharacterized protein YifE (UPF0438 family)